MGKFFLILTLIYFSYELPDPAPDYEADFDSEIFAVYNGDGITEAYMQDAVFEKALTVVEEVRERWELSQDIVGGD